MKKFYKWMMSIFDRVIQMYNTIGQSSDYITETKIIEKDRNGVRKEAEKVKNNTSKTILSGILSIVCD